MGIECMRRFVTIENHEQKNEQKNVGGNLGEIVNQFSSPKNFSLCTFSLFLSGRFYLSAPDLNFTDRGMQIS